MRQLTFAIAFTLALMTACNKNQVTTGDPADGNLAPTGQAAAPAQPAADQSAAPAAAPAADYNDVEAADSADAVTAPDPPPPLPDYDQPPCPGDNYMWTPGYWDYAGAGYYWVPGAWVMAPWVGALWTPPWWGDDNGAYLFHAGYWGPYIGFYGGIDYGFGYTGHGYYGAYWRGGNVFYNRSVTNIDTTAVHNVYNYSVAAGRGPRVSYNGGRGGITVRPSAPEVAAFRDRRSPAVEAQVQQARESAGRREQFATGANPHPQALVAARPLATEYRAPAEHAPAPVARPETRPPAEHSEPVTRPAPAPRSAPEERAMPATPERAAPEEHRAPAPHPATPERPAPEEHRAAAPEYRAPAPRPAPEQHAAPPRPAPQQHAAPERRSPPPPPKKDAKDDDNGLARR